MKKLLATAICSVMCAVAIADDIVAATLRDDGSTNTWTQTDLQDALGMMNRMYWRDVQNESGRVRWHGKLMGQYAFTNANGRICSVQLYADTFAWTNEAYSAGSSIPDPEAAAKAAARAEAARRAWEEKNLPPELAALRAGQREAAATTNEVTVIVTPGGN